MTADDWLREVAFIRLEFPPDQRDVAQQLALFLAGCVGRKITRLRPEHTVAEILGWRDGDSLEAVELIMAIEEESRFPLEAGTTFRQWVEHTVRIARAAG